LEFVYVKTVAENCQENRKNWRRSVPTYNPNLLSRDKYSRDSYNKGNEELKMAYGD